MRLKDKVAKVVAAILAEDADVVAAAIRAYGGEAFAAKIDVTNEAEWVGLIGRRWRPTGPAPPARVAQRYG